MSRTSQRGMTLLELTVVIALATLGMLGVTFFYLSSQATWMDGSAQAITQREASLIVRELRDSLRVAARAVVFDSPDSLRQGIYLVNNHGDEFYRFWWNAADSLIHERTGSGSDRGPIGRSRVEQFRFGRAASLVELKLLQMRSQRGQRVMISTTVNQYNR